MVVLEKRASVPLPLRMQGAKYAPNKQRYEVENKRRRNKTHDKGEQLLRPVLRDGDGLGHGVRLSSTTPKQRVVTPYNRKSCATANEKMKKFAGIQALAPNFQVKLVLNYLYSGKIIQFDGVFVAFATAFARFAQQFCFASQRFAMPGREVI